MTGVCTLPLPVHLRRSLRTAKPNRPRKRDAERLGRAALHEKVPSPVRPTLQQDLNVATVSNAATLGKRPGRDGARMGFPEREVTILKQNELFQLTLTIMMITDVSKAPTLRLINTGSNIIMSKMFTHTHTHTVQMDRGLGQCCLAEIFGAETCFEFAFEFDAMMEESHYNSQTDRVPGVLGEIVLNVGIK